ncbi:hypothetical protein OZX62_00100 [Bifidobacterium sp. ESL0690]|uniref:hypothetical protein n=1 Tax=Bifidobacterium sp. ESL0690 TaxID=2983214 RepID=UPI0023F87CD7|nr:hypothetical protein [Bifidobacterium sp. ESL0690]WEV46753.1 hypothetical protein OZX62_00100 [Bifidobacterium sp. ESL0690]
MGKPISMSISTMDDAIKLLRILANDCAPYNAADKQGGGAVIDTIHGVDQSYSTMVQQMENLFSSTATFLEKARNSYKNSDDRASWQFKG